MKTLLLVLILALMGCISPPPPHIDPPFGPYVSSFVAAAESFGRHLDTSDLTVQFVDPHVLSTNKIIAQCDYSSNTISVNPILWQEYSTALGEHEAILFHELGHCLLHRYHEEATIEDIAAWRGRRPASVMYHENFNNQDYLNHREGYLLELFTAPSNF